MNTGPVVVGERVRAVWKGCNYKGVFYEGVVAGINDDETFRITFDDGDESMRMRAALPSTSPATCSSRLCPLT